MSRAKLLKPELEYVSKYFICEDCADEKGFKLPDNFIGSVTIGLCGHCREAESKTLILITEFDTYKINKLYE